MAHWRSFVGIAVAIMVLGSCTSEQAAAFSEVNETAARTLHNTARVLELSQLTPVEIIARNAAVKVADPFGRAGFPSSRVSGILATSALASPETANSISIIETLSPRRFGTTNSRPWRNRRN